MKGIDKLASVFESITNISRISGDIAGKVNDELMYSSGIGGLTSVLDNYDLAIGDSFNKSQKFLIDKDGNNIINAFIDKEFDFGSNKDVYKIKPKDMRGLLVEHKVSKEKKPKKDFINSMEAYNRWDENA